MRARITLIHAVSVAIQPARDAFRAAWPEADLANLLDDGLTAALAREGGLTAPLVQRICDLATYAARTGADGILFTCSAFTPAMDVARRLVGVPLLKPDEAMIGRALDTGTRIGLLATFPPTLPASASQFRAAAAERGGTVDLVAAAVPEALAALSAADPGAHDRLLAEAAARLPADLDAICLAQFSMARAVPAVQARVPVPVLSSPGAQPLGGGALLAARGSPP